MDLADTMQKVWEWFGLGDKENDVARPWAARRRLT